MNNFKVKAITYQEKFIWGELNDPLKYYDFEHGIFAVNRNSDGINEVFWAVDNLSVLKAGLDLIQEDFSTFLFRYANHYDQVVKNSKLIESWNYQLKDIHVGYVLDFNEAKLEFTSNLEISSLKMSELNEFQNLEKSIFELFNVSKEELADWVDDQDHMILILRKDDRMIGFIILEIYGENKNTCFIRNLGIRKEYRGKGYGEQLTRHALKLASNQGVIRSFLWVGNANDEATKLYEKIGYQLDPKECEAVFIK